MFYGDAAGYRAYLIARGYDPGTLTDGEVNSKLLIASEWIDAQYDREFPGERVGQRAQVRSWPRAGAVDRNGYSIDSTIIPDEVVNATYEAAYREQKSPGSLSVDYTPSKYKSASVSGAVAVTYRDFGGAADVQTQFKVINDIIAMVLCDHGGSMLSGETLRS